MSLSIAAAVDRLVGIERNLEIIDPATIKVARAYTGPPPSRRTLNDVPCFINTWRFIRELRGNGARSLYYEIHPQLVVRDADTDQAHAIAAGFLEAFLFALDADVDLGGSVSNQHLRGGDPTVVTYTFAGKRYIGLDLFIDVEMLLQPTTIAISREALP
jgi:hypothetical protein